MTQFDLLFECIFRQENLDELSRRLAVWRFKSQKIVFTYGLFDVIHKGHIEYLAKAAELGDVLIVGIYSDNFAKELKGEKSLMQDEYSRATILSSLQYVKAVVSIDNDPSQLIETISPDILVIGSESETMHNCCCVLQNGGSIVNIKTINTKDTLGIIMPNNDVYK
jgi:rfaE bifunctional protein nucleotidyltransferase chain/domain